MEYNLVRRNKKSISLKINQNGEILVYAPKKCSLKFINEFVNSKKDWILKHQIIIKQNQDKYKDFFSLNRILIFGEEYNILDFGNHYQIGNFYVKHTKASRKEQVIKKFLMQLANDYILNRTKEIATTLNLNYNQAEIISARKKWGSCSNAKNLKFNFRLIMLPKKLIDYVICHELCHLKQMNHSKEFWNLLQDLGYNKTNLKESFKPYSFVLQVV